ncbi:hypothetical protein H4Q26_003644 [Puccinia striiformis f. sp. tritici PST-130]|nr:hypothetical protein H4Q26_003644 [Puccinia striiformis f. sp. tritici PST-130]
MRWYFVISFYWVSLPVTARLGSELATSEVREVIPGSNASKTPDLNLLPIDEDSTTEPVYSSQAGGARLRIEPATSEIKEIIPGSNAFRVPDLNFLPMAQDLTAEPVCSSQAGGTAFTSEKDKRCKTRDIRKKLDPGRQLLSNLLLANARWTMDWSQSQEKPSSLPG